jgi:outer membrane protein OmpA-like peptidoglycan-associated protein
MKQNTFQFLPFFFKKSICFLLFGLAFQSLAAQSVFDSLYEAHRLELYFASGKAVLEPAAKQTLDSVLLLFQQSEGKKTVRITAHTDSVGDLAYNEQLSLRRAAVVSNWLKSKGLPESSIISVTGFGERLPASTNSTETGRLLNRRATIELARQIPMKLLEGRVTDKSNGLGLKATVIFSTKTRQDSIDTDSSGQYRVQLPKDSMVKIEVYKKDYFFQSTVMNQMGNPDIFHQYKFSPEIVLQPAKPGETIILRNFYFIGNEARLVKASEPELPKILKFMQINPEVTIEIGGHINIPYPQDQAYPLKPGQTPAAYIMANQEPELQSLSLRRAELVQRYLVNNGIDASRMVAKGYKNSKMLYPYTGCSSLQQQMNRRVEITVTGRTRD